MRDAFGDKIKNVNSTKSQIELIRSKHLGPYSGEVAVLKGDMQTSLLKLSNTYVTGKLDRTTLVNQFSLQ